ECWSCSALSVPPTSRCSKKRRSTSRPLPPCTTACRCGTSPMSFSHAYPSTWWSRVPTTSAGATGAPPKRSSDRSQPWALFHRGGALSKLRDTVIAPGAGSCPPPATPLPSGAATCPIRPRVPTGRHRAGESSHTVTVNHARARRRAGTPLARCSRDTTTTSRQRGQGRRRADEASDRGADRCSSRLHFRRRLRQGTEAGRQDRAKMENQKGVGVDLVSTTQGANVARGVDGVKMKLQR